jgi:hypothetical protein
MLCAAHLPLYTPRLHANTQVSRAELEAAASSVGDFGSDNRAGIPGTLHRISALRSRSGGVVGLTCRVGRAVSGHAHMVRDILEGEWVWWRDIDHHASHITMQGRLCFLTCFTTIHGANISHKYCVAAPLACWLPLPIKPQRHSQTHAPIQASAENSILHPSTAITQVTRCALPLC